MIFKHYDEIRFTQLILYHKVFLSAFDLYEMCKSNKITYYNST